MTDLNVKKEYLNLIYADCGKGSAGEKIKELVTVPGTQYLIFGVILGVFPLLAQLGILTSSFVFAMGNTMIYAIMAIGFCLLMGYSGLASLGTAGFVGIGAYIAYYFMQVYGAPFGIAFIVTVMISLFSGVLVGFISLRIEGIYLAILTLGLSEILRNTFISLKSSIKLDMSKVRLFGVKIGEEQVYLLILALFVLLLFITSNLIRSPIGRALLSVKNSTSAAQAMGINLMKYRVLAFVISTVYAAIAGLMYMMLLRNMTTSTSTLLSMATSDTLCQGCLRNFFAVIQNKPLDFVTHGFLARFAEMDCNTVGSLSDFLYHDRLRGFLYGQRGSGSGGSAVGGFIVHRLSFHRKSPYAVYT